MHIIDRTNKNSLLKDLLWTCNKDIIKIHTYVREDGALPKGRRWYWNSVTVVYFRLVSVRGYAFSFVKACEGVGKGLSLLPRSPSAPYRVHRQLVVAYLPFMLDHRYNWGSPFRKSNRFYYTLVLKSCEFLFHLSAQRVGNRSGSEEPWLLRGVNMQRNRGSSNLAEFPIAG